MFTIGLGHQREPRKRNRYCKQREFSQPNEISLANKDVKPYYKMKMLIYENNTINNISVNQDLPILLLPIRPQSLVILSIKHLNYFSTCSHIFLDSKDQYLRLCRIALNRILTFTSVCYFKCPNKTISPPLGVKQSFCYFFSAQTQYIISKEK